MTSERIKTDSATVAAGEMLAALGDDAPQLTQAEFEELAESIREGDRIVDGVANDEDDDLTPEEEAEIAAYVERLGKEIDAADDERKRRIWAEIK